MVWSSQRFLLGSLQEVAILSRMAHRSMASYRNVSEFGYEPELVVIEWVYVLQP